MQKRDHRALQQAQTSFVHESEQRLRLLEMELLNLKPPATDHLKLDRAEVKRLVGEIKADARALLKDLRVLANYRDHEEDFEQIVGELEDSLWQLKGQ